MKERRRRRRWREDFEDGIFEDEEQGNPRQSYVVLVLGVYWVCCLIFGIRGVCRILVGILVISIITIIIVCCLIQ